MPQGVTIRVAEPSGRDSILTVVREAFTRGGRDGQEEVDIVVNTWIRRLSAFDPSDYGQFTYCWGS